MGVKGPVSRKAILALVEGGYHPTTVALTLGLEVNDVLECLPATERRQFVADDETINQAMRVLAWRTIEEALRILDEGTPQQRMSIITKFGGQLQQVIGKEETTDPLEELRADFFALTAEMREGVPDVVDPAVGEAPVDRN